MGDYLKYLKLCVALLVTGGATLLISCDTETVVQYNPETLLTQRSDTLTTIESTNGLKKMRFETPLMESYELAREPYTEFRRGVFLETFKDSTETIEMTLVADYAINYKDRAIWEARGNVVVVSEEGNRTLYTEQLFWDQKTERIYSNVDSRVVQNKDIFDGEGFESDDKFKEWSFRNYKGRMEVEMSRGERSDSVSAADMTPAAEPDRNTGQEPAEIVSLAPAPTENRRRIVKQPEDSGFPAPAPDPDARPVRGNPGRSMGRSDSPASGRPSAISSENAAQENRRGMVREPMPLRTIAPVTDAETKTAE